MREEVFHVNPPNVGVEVRFDLLQFGGIDAEDIEKIVRAEFEATLCSLLPIIFREMYGPQG